MEPRSFERGKVTLQGKGLTKCIASMEPRSFERGKPNMQQRPGRDATRFNGAAFV